MDKSTALAAVSSFSDAMRNTYQPIKVVLYGSYAQEHHKGAHALTNNYNINTM